MSIIRNVHYTKCPLRNVRYSKCPYTKFPYTKCPPIILSICFVPLTPMKYKNGTIIFGFIIRCNSFFQNRIATVVILVSSTCLGTVVSLFSAATSETTIAVEQLQ